MPRNLDSFAAEYFRAVRAPRDDAPRADRVRDQRRVLSTPTWKLNELVREAPEEAWPLILALVERASTDEDVAFVAAGPVEDLIGEHGPAFSSRIAAEARANPRFRVALNYVWGWERLPSDVQAELLPLLDPEVRAAAEEAPARQDGKRASKERWRPQQPRRKSSLK